MVARVLVFAPTLGQGGADRVLLTLLKRFDRDRFAPTLVLVRRDGPWLAEVPADVPIVELGLHRLALAVPELVRTIWRLEPDVVFSLQGGTNMVAGAAHALARSPSRLVLSERSTLRRPDRSRARSSVEIPLKRVTYRRADVVTALSNGVARELTEILHVPASKVRVIYNPTVDDELFARAKEPVAHPWFSDAVPIVLAVGRLVDIKDYPTLLDAFAKLRATRPARLAILGEGPLREALVARATQLGISGDVAFLGFDTNPFKYMARARVLLHTSKSEGLGSVIIQAMACGTPVVATDCEVGPREIITPGRDGYLAPVGDAAQLAGYVTRALDERERLSPIAAASARRFTTESAVRAFEASLTGA